MTAVNYCFTLNNFSEEELRFARELVESDGGVKFICFSKEVGASGTPHLQGFLGFNSPQRLSRCKGLFPRAHFERMRGLLSQNKDYCSKEGELEIFGDVPKDSKKVNSERWAEAIQAAKIGDFDAIPPDLYTRHYRFYEKLANDNVVVPEVLDGDLQVRMFWIYGAPRTGKSMKARAMCLEKTGAKAYCKNKNKWWCRYNGTGGVLIEEWSPDYMMLSDMLKIWSDRYEFEGETKGGSRLMRPSHIFVTSNYSIEECFRGPDVEALKARFTEILVN